MNETPREFSRAVMVGRWFMVALQKTDNAKPPLRRQWKHNATPTLLSSTASTQQRTGSEPHAKQNAKQNAGRAIRSPLNPSQGDDGGGLHS